jgi:hypothetical protein
LQCEFDPAVKTSQFYKELEKNNVDFDLKTKLHKRSYYKDYCSFMAPYRVDPELSKIFMKGVMEKYIMSSILFSNRVR